MHQAYHGGRLVEAAREFGLSEDAFVDFSTNTNVFAPAVPLAVWEKWRDQIARYPESDASAIRNRLALLYNVDADHILPTAGAIEALYLAARIFAGHKVGIIEPAFSDYERAFRTAGSDWERIVLTREMWHAPASTLKHLLEPFDVVVLGNPNNPTGALRPRKQLLALVEKSWRRPKTWIVDEAFIEFVAGHEEESLLPVLSEYRSLIVVYSLTKTWNIPGLRLGFLATSNAAWMERLRMMQPPWSVNSVAQAWSAEYLTAENHARMLAGLCELRNTRSRFEAALSEIAGLRLYPAAANFLLIELLESSLDAWHLYRELGSHGLLVRVCDSFQGMPKGRFIRVAVRTEDENNRLARELASICIERNRRAA